MNENPPAIEISEIEDPSTRRRLTERFLTDEILPQAVKRHLEILRDPKVTGQTLNRAIELALKYGLGDVDADHPKEPHEMSAEELSRRIASLERVAADRAKPVRSSAVDAVAKRNVFD